MSRLKSVLSTPDIFGQAFSAFDHFLDGPADQAVGVAVSGGGDSVALLYALAEWGKRPLEVFCVDHGLNPASPQWTDSVVRQADTFGAGFTALHWTGDKPKTGVSAKARAARHALLADAARQKGVRVLCLAHTLDDIAEAEHMQAEGSNVTAPALWSPSPAWPEGRGLFLLRPFLDQRREGLREILRDVGLGWIDDPANDSCNSLRARVRQELAGRTFTPPDLTPPAQDDLTDLLRDADTLGALGMIVFDADVFAALPRPVALKRLATALVSAGGGDKLPRRSNLEALLDGLPAGKALGLCGARARQENGRIEIVREPGDIALRGSGDMRLAPGVEGVWDGRFAMETGRGGVIAPSGKVRAQLDDADRSALRALPEALRTGLPAVQWSGEKNWSLANASLRQTPYNDMTSRCWTLPRFLAASGRVARERDLDDGTQKGQ